MFFKKYGDIVVAIFFMTISVLMMIGAQRLPKSTVMEIGPDFMPMCVSIITFLLASLLLFFSIKGLKNNIALAESSPVEEADYMRVLLSSILILIYVFILQPIGFIISTLIYLPLQMFVLAPSDKRDKKNVIQLVIISVAFTFCVFFLFRYGFKIVLPAGIFTINL